MSLAILRGTGETFYPARTHTLLELLIRRVRKSHRNSVGFVAMNWSGLVRLQTAPAKGRSHTLRQSRTTISHSVVLWDAVACQQRDCTRTSEAELDNTIVFRS